MEGNPNNRMQQLREQLINAERDNNEGEVLRIENEIRALESVENQNSPEESVTESLNDNKEELLEGGVEQESKKELDNNQEEKNEQEVSRLREEILGNESNESGSVGQLVSTLRDAQNKFMDKEEFGTEGEKAAEKVEEIIMGIENFVAKIQDDYKKEYQRTGIKADDFMREYGIASLEKDMGGLAWLPIEYYSFEDIKKDHEDDKNKGRRSFDDFAVTLFRKYDWSRETRKVPLFSKWEREEIHEEWFSPQQEKFLYKILTGENDFKVKENGHFGKEIKTFIPGIGLRLEKEVNTMDKQNPGKKPVVKELNKRGYGWSRRESYLILKKQAVKQILEDSI